MTYSRRTSELRSVRANLANALHSISSYKDALEAVSPDAAKSAGVKRDIKPAKKRTVARNRTN